MSTAKSTAAALLPTKEEAVKELENYSGVLAGVVVAHGVMVMTKKDKPLINGGVALGGLALAIKAPNPWLKMVGLGVATYGSLKLMGNLLKEVAAPETTQGLNGILPESAKALIRKFIPTLSGDEDMHGAYDKLNGDDDMRGTDDLSLDDESMRGDDDMRGTEEMQGIGSATKAY